MQESVSFSFAESICLKVILKGRTTASPQRTKLKWPQTLCNAGKKELPGLSDIHVNACISSTYDVKLLVAKSDFAFPPALHQWYICGAKFKDQIGLLVGEQCF